MNKIKHAIITNGVQPRRDYRSYHTGLRHLRQGSVNEPIWDWISGDTIRVSTPCRSLIAAVCYARWDGRSFPRIAPRMIKRWWNDSEEKERQGGVKIRGMDYSWLYDRVLLGEIRDFIDISPQVSQSRESHARNLSRDAQLSTITRCWPWF